MTVTALLVRHCESTGQEPEAPLSPAGRKQAEQLARALRSRAIGGVISSPYRRARETAQPLVADTSDDLELDSRLREWELPWIPDAQWPGALRPIFAGALPPGVEPIASARARVVAAVHDALARDRCHVLVTHGKLLALALSELQGGDPFAVFRAIRNPHVFELRASRSGIEVCAQWHLGNMPTADRVKRRARVSPDTTRRE